MNRVLTSILVAAFFILGTNSLHGVAQARQNAAPLPELSVWKAEIAALPMDRKAVEAKRSELYALFLGRNVSNEVYTEYATALQSAFNALRAAEGRAGILNSYSLSLNNVNEENSEDTRRLFLGEFSRITLRRDSYRFDSYLRSYLLAYGEKCEARRPPQAVEIPVVRCTVTRETYNGFGIFLGSGCAKWEKVGSNRFGDPALVAAVEKISESMASKTVSQFSSMVANPGSLSRVVAEATRAARAMEMLVGNNECSHPGMRRFADNLLRFAEGQPPLTLPASASASATPSLYDACMAEGSAGSPKSRSEEYCRCIDRQYVNSGALTLAEREKYARDFDAFRRDALDAKPGAPGFDQRLYGPQILCRRY